MGRLDANADNYWWDAAQLAYDADAIQVEALYPRSVLEFMNLTQALAPEHRVRTLLAGTPRITEDEAPLKVMVNTDPVELCKRQCRN
jgi:hypothetical protein